MPNKTPSLILLSATALLIPSCHQNSSAYDDAWAECEASTPLRPPGQPDIDRQEEILQCIAAKGVTG